MANKTTLAAGGTAFTMPRYRLETSSATVRYDRALTQPAQFTAELQRVTGYEATVVDGGSDADATDTAPASAPASAAQSTGDR